MKKLVFFITPFIVSGTLVAQAPVSGQLQMRSNIPQPYSKYRADLHVSGPGSTGEPIGQPKSTTITPVGISTYQLQSNSSVQNRIVNNSDGTISLSWILSTQTASLTWPDRGTGYNYYDGSNWLTAPTSRIETVRTGWPSLMVLGNNSEVVITHNTASENLYLSRRPVKGTGTWTHNSTIINSAAPLGNFWPRAINGGSDNNTIHLISISNPVDAANGNAPVFFRGQQGAITYSRSTDGGTTWPVLHTIPAEHDSSQYYGFDGDSYAIDASGNTVAYVIGGFTNDLFLMKSTDNGDTWTKTVIMQFPIPFFRDQITDVNSDMIADTVETNDGALAVLIDDNDDVHVWFGAMRILNEDSTDEQISYFPGTSGLMYWNESMGAADPVTIAGLEDIDEDGALNVAAGAWGTYQVSLSGQPSAGIDANGVINLTYAALVEGSNDGGDKCVRNIYHMSTPDGGVNWTTPRRINPDDYTEQVYCSMVRNTETDCISMVYQSDISAGHGVGTDNVDNASNFSETTDQMYVCFDPLSFTGTEVIDLSGNISLYPNPAVNTVNLSSVNVINRVEIYTLQGTLVQSFTPNSNQPVLDVERLSSGMYLVSVYCGNNKVTKRMIRK